MSSKSLLLLATILAVGTLSCSQPAPERDTTADKRAVSQVGEREIRALSAGNIDSNVAVLAQDVVMMPPGEKMHRGAADLPATLRHPN